MSCLCSYNALGSSNKFDWGGGVQFQACEYIFMISEAKYCEQSSSDTNKNHNLKLLL